jgi:hypothetical protein
MLAPAALPVPLSQASKPSGEASLVHMRCWRTYEHCFGMRCHAALWSCTHVLHVLIMSSCCTALSGQQAKCSASVMLCKALQSSSQVCLCRAGLGASSELVCYSLHQRP